jgi:dTDP-4-amino-4,6-dideoxygalactose transaminase
MEQIWSLAKKHNLFVIEDAAHAAGTLYRGQHVGSKGFPSDAVAFSFYATKNMTTGEGGMVTTNDETLMNRMRILALHGINKDAWGRYRENGNWYYEVLEAGFKYNLSDIQSAIGIPQLHKLERFVERRRQYAELYNHAFANIQ